MQWNKHLLQDDHGEWYIHLGSADLKVARHGEGENEAEYVFPMDLLQDLEEYRTVHWPILVRDNPDCPYVFPSHHGQQMGLNSITKRLKRVSKLVLGRAITLHRYRDAFASDVGARTGNMVIVKHMLNHKSLKTTETHYSRVNTRELSRAYDRQRLGAKQMTAEERERKIQAIMEQGVPRKAAERLLDRLDGIDNTGGTAA